MTMAQLLALLEGASPREAKAKPLTPAQRERLSRSPLFNSGLVVNR